MLEVGEGGPVARQGRVLSAVHNLYLLIISSTFADINRSSGPEVALLHQQTDSFILGSRLHLQIVGSTKAYFNYLYAQFLDVDGSS